MLKLTEDQMSIYNLSEQYLHPASHGFKAGLLLNSSDHAVCMCRAFKAL